jgi:hypothetical protein
MEKAPQQQQDLQQLQLQQPLQQGAGGGGGMRGPSVPAEHPAFALAQRPSSLKGRASHRSDDGRQGYGGSGGAPPSAAAIPPPRASVDKRSITLLVTEHADRLRQAMMAVVEKGSGVDKQAVSDAIGAESLKLRDALNNLLLP